MSSSCNFHGITDFSNITSQLFSSEESELLVLADESNTDVMLSELSLLSASLECLHSVSHELLPTEVSKGLIVLLEISLG